MADILIVDDESSICWGLSRLALSMGHTARVASSAEEGLALSAAQAPDALVLDVRLPGVDGLSAMKDFQRLLGDSPIVIVTAFGDLPTAMMALENGAFEYVVKPFDLPEIRAALQRALRSRERRPTPPECTAVSIDGMLGRTPAMQAVFKRIALAAKADASVLISGESGVGKELAAAAIHRHSARKDAPFVAVNVAALSPTLAEAELFGHVAGAFTGAGQDRKGLLVQADGGTLFLDEVADIPLSLQVKLLRALDQSEVLPVGADRPVKARFRTVSATHQDLRAKVRTGEFRHDLYFRLCTFEVSLPSLRDRRSDISLLARHFATEFGGPTAVLVDETLAELVRRPWYGNVRELRSAIEHALVIARSGEILPSHLPESLPNIAVKTQDGREQTQQLSAAVAELAQALLVDPANTGFAYDRFLEAVEPAFLAVAMSQSGQQCAPAARTLGLHRTTLKRKLDRYGLDELPNEG